jgi:hypothetical protein
LSFQLTEIEQTSKMPAEMLCSSFSFSAQRFGLRSGRGRGQDHVFITGPECLRWWQLFMVAEPWATPIAWAKRMGHSQILSLLEGDSGVGTPVC